MVVQVVENEAEAGMKHGIGVVAVLLALVFAGGARADVAESAADGFLIKWSVTLKGAPKRVWTTLGQPQLWWDSEHTWSGKASNLGLKAEAGGCFCERWDGGSAEHGHVVMALPGQLLRLEAALGPLQEYALKGVLSFWLKPAGDDTTLDLEYRVNGAQASGLEAFAPKVDQVIGAQVERLRRYLATGSPELPVAQPSPSAAGEDAAARARAAILEEWKKSAEEQAAADKAAARPAKGAADAKH